MGDTARDAVWRALAAMLAENWTHASGVAMPLARFALDTGFATQEAYAFVRACHDPRVMAVKGVPRGAALIGTPTAIDVSQGGKKLRRGIKVFTVAVGIAKLEFYNNLRKSADVGEDGLTPVFPAGFVHLPKIDAEFIQQLCAEQLIKADILGGADAAYDTLVEIQQLLQNGTTGLDALLAAVSLRVRFDAAQTLTVAEQLQARTNIGAVAAADVGNTDTDFVVVFDGALA